MYRSKIFQCVFVLALAMLSLSGRASEILFQQGMNDYEDGNFEQAETIFARLLKEGENIAQLHNNLAAVYSAQGHYDKALEQLQGALRHSGIAKTAFDNLNKLYGVMASQAYRQAMGDQPEVVEPLDLVLVQEWQESVKPTIDLKKVTLTAQPFDKEAAEYELLEAVNQWAAAWSAQDVEAYLASYSNQFVPQLKVSRDVWKKTRRTRLESPSFINVSISEVNIAYLSAEFASVIFLQTYQSDRLNDTVAKNLIFSKVEGQWKIIQEQLIR